MSVPSQSEDNDGGGGGDEPPEREGTTLSIQLLEKRESQPVEGLLPYSKEEGGTYIV